jgi:phosphoheptose isomerase
MIPATIETELKSHQQILEQTIGQSAELIDSMAVSMANCFKQGNKILLCGN